MKLITSSFVLLLSSTVALAQNSTTNTVTCKKAGASLALFLGLPFQPYIWSEEKCLNTCGANGETCSWSQVNGICECPIITNGGVSSSSSRITSTTSTFSTSVSTAISTSSCSSAVPTSTSSSSRSTSSSSSTISQQPSVSPQNISPTKTTFAPTVIAVVSVTSTPTVLAVVNVTSSSNTAPQEMEPVDMYDALGFELKCADPKRTLLTDAENKPGLLLKMDKQTCKTKCSETGNICEWSKKKGCVCPVRSCQNDDQVPVPYGQYQQVMAVNADKCKKFCKDDGSPCEYDWSDKRCNCEVEILLPEPTPEPAHFDKASPLLFDLNKDGVIKAISGPGIDLNDDGVGEAAAGPGDGLLALYSIARGEDGVLDEKNVFGTELFNPFLNKTIETKDGFEALIKLADSAQDANPGMEIVKGDNIYMWELNKALNKIKYALGFLMTTGATKREDVMSLGDVYIVKRTYIARKDRDEKYLEEQEKNRVAFIEEGRWISSKGKIFEVVDAWYRLLDGNNTGTVEVSFSGYDPKNVFSSLVTQSALEATVNSGSFTIAIVNNVWLFVVALMTISWAF